MTRAEARANRLREALKAAAEAGRAVGSATIGRDGAITLTFSKALTEPSEGDELEARMNSRLGQASGARAN